MKSFKFGGFLLAAFILAWIFNYTKYNKSSKDLRNEDIVILNKAFTESSLELFGKGVNAQNVGDCSTSEIYRLIEFDTNQLRLFRSFGIKSLRQTIYDSIQLANAKCIIENIIDTTFKIKLSPEAEEQMRLKLRNEMKEVASQTGKNLDTLCDCLISQINGMTVNQYMSGYFGNAELPKYIGFCLDKQTK